MYLAVELNVRNISLFPQIVDRKPLTIVVALLLTIPAHQLKQTALSDVEIIQCRPGRAVEIEAVLQTVLVDRQLIADRAFR